MSEINEFTAYAYSDNYSIMGPIECVGCEHNETEAKALCSYLNGRNGGGYTVRKNRLDQVRDAKSFVATPYRHQLRDQAFAAVGIYGSRKVKS